jgi:hypothetical protein
VNIFGGLGGLAVFGIPAKAIAIGAAMTISLASLAVVSSGVLTDSDVVDELAFDAGGIDLTVSTDSALVTMTTPVMTPGDSYTAPFTVGNAGDVELRYAMVSTTTEDVLAGQLILTIRSGVAVCTTVDWDRSGTELYRGPIGAADTRFVFGSPAEGQHDGDRTIAGGADDELCFNVTLPIEAGNVAQGITSTATFTFFAEQSVVDRGNGAELDQAD